MATTCRALGAGALALGSGAFVILLAERHWRGETARLVNRLESGLHGDQARACKTFTQASLQGLPAPVRRYFSTVLREGQPIAHGVWLRQEGSLCLQTGTNGWRPFTAEQRCTNRPGPGFVWDARIRLAPGVAVRVRDALVEGRGSMCARLHGLFPLITMENTPELALGALYRYLAEAVWCPTMLLPSQGVVWAPLDSGSARATLRVGSVIASLDFHFGADGLVQSVFTAGRPRERNGTFVLTPWQGRFADYQERGGMYIPLRGEVEWLPPDNPPQVYWQGRIMAIRYDILGPLRVRAESAV